MTKPVIVERSGKRYRQEVIFLAEWYQPGIALKARPVPVAEKPDLVWTLFREEDPVRPPKLPIIPIHQVNAFAEDHVHDWNWQASGMFSYASRVADRPVWVLLEYEVKS